MGWKTTKFLVIFLILAAVAFGFWHRDGIRDAAFAYRRVRLVASLPEALPYEKFLGNSGGDTAADVSPAQIFSEVSPAASPSEASPAESPETSPQFQEYPDAQEAPALPEEINLAVPFTPQAPHANWELPYKEACEEASLLMVARYKNDAPIRSREDADEEIRALVAFQNGLFGDYKDTTAEQTAEIAREYYGFKNTEVVYDFTVEDVKREVAVGNPVIIPAAGKILPNPYFRTPGPLYHMLVIRGYTKDRFITNDPGTKRGEEFTYTFDELLNAAHDWNGGDVANGQRAMIVVR